VRRSDPCDLSRFVDAQATIYDQALAELRRGRKASHWMWFVFPQFAGLGSSALSRRYAIRSRVEAEAYLAHPVLGPRLVECAGALLEVEGRTATEILGSPDDLKLRSCATLFAAVAARPSIFTRLLDRLFDGLADDQTMQLLARAEGR
jgi:uncharacterized protein (DUF1810 family)